MLLRFTQDKAQDKAVKITKAEALRLAVRALEKQYKDLAVDANLTRFGYKGGEKAVRTREKIQLAIDLLKKL